MHNRNAAQVEYCVKGFSRRWGLGIVLFLLSLSGSSCSQNMSPDEQGQRSAAGGIRLRGEKVICGQQRDSGWSGARVALTVSSEDLDDLSSRGPVHSLEICATKPLSVTEFSKLVVAAPEIETLIISGLAYPSGDAIRSLEALSGLKELWIEMPPISCLDLVTEAERKKSIDETIPAVASLGGLESLTILNARPPFGDLGKLNGLKVLRLCGLIDSAEFAPALLLQMPELESVYFSGYAYSDPLAGGKVLEIVSRHATMDSVTFGEGVQLGTDDLVSFIDAAPHQFRRLSMETVTMVFTR